MSTIICRTALGSAVMSSSGDVAGFEHGNIVTDNTIEGWLGNSADAWVRFDTAPLARDFICVYAPDLAGSGSGVKLQDSVDGVAWDDVHETYYPSSMAPFIIRVALGTESYHRLLMVGDAVEIVYFSIGVAVEIPYGLGSTWSRPLVNSEMDTLSRSNAVAIGAGSHSDKIDSIRIPISSITKEQLDNDFMPLLESSGGRFLALSIDDEFDDSAYMCVINKITGPTISGSMYYDININARAVF